MGVLRNRVRAIQLGSTASSTLATLGSINEHYFDMVKNMLEAQAVCGQTQEMHTMKKDKKYYLGITLFVCSLIPYVFILLVLPFLPVSQVKAVSIATGLVIFSEISFLLCVVLLGKPFVQLLKSKIKTIFRKKGVAHLKPVGKVRHYVGITMLLVACIVPYFLTEIALLLGYVEKYGHTVLVGLLILGDVLFITSFFLLGGEFWARVNKLFEWPGKAEVPENSN